MFLNIILTFEEHSRVVWNVQEKIFRIDEPIGLENGVGGIM